MTTDSTALPFQQPLQHMLAQSADAIPEGDGWLYEPKWDGFRTLVFFDGKTASTCRAATSSRWDATSLSSRRALAAPCRGPMIIDGEIVIAGPKGLDFDALQMRLHPAASRVNMLAEQTPSSFVAFDLLAIGGEDLRDVPFGQRRKRLEAALKDVGPPVYLTPSTDDPKLAQDWFERFEGAGLDGVVAKRTRAAVHAGQARDAEDQAPAHRRLRRRRLSLEPRRGGQVASARCCWGFTTRAACSTTSATRRASRRRRSESWCRSWSPTWLRTTSPASATDARRAGSAAGPAAAT